MLHSPQKKASSSAAPFSVPPAPKKPRKETNQVARGTPKRLTFAGDTKTRGEEKYKDLAALVLPHVKHWKDFSLARVWKHAPIILTTKDGKPLAYVLLRYSSALRKLCPTKLCRCGGKQVDIVHVCVAREHQRKGWATRIACAIYRVAAAFGLSLYLEQCITTGSKKLGASLFRRLKGGEQVDSRFYECGQAQTLARTNDTPAGLLGVVSEKQQRARFDELYAQLM